MCVCVWRGLYPTGQSKGYRPGRLQNILRSMNNTHTIDFSLAPNVRSAENGEKSFSRSHLREDFWLIRVSIFSLPKYHHCFPQSTHLSVVMHHLRIGTTSILLFTFCPQWLAQSYVYWMYSEGRKKRRGKGRQRRKWGSKIHLCLWALNLSIVCWYN